MRFEMKNLTSFPMEKLCFDLKLEALEQMEPRDVVELAKVNQGFQGMLVRDPSIVFGEHVFGIELRDEESRIKKFSNSAERKYNVIHESFVKKVRWCDQLSLEMNHGWRNDLEIQMDDELAEKYTLLKNLKSVNGLLLAWDSKKAQERFFLNFHGSIKKKAVLQICCSAFDDQVIKDRIENFIVGPQLKDCEKISFVDLTEEAFRFYYNTLLRSEIKNVSMLTWGCIDLIVQQIMTNGIPSKNHEAAIFLDSYDFHFTMDLLQYPRMRRIDGENRLRLLKQANYLARNFGYWNSDGSDFFLEESSMYRRCFDSTKDCIFVYKNRYTRCFLAFYVPVD